eukprot:scaffold139046_cov27-Tisochrysis_lutea.AAC.1
MSVGRFLVYDVTSCAYTWARRKVRGGNTHFATSWAVCMRTTNKNKCKCMPVQRHQRQLAARARGLQVQARRAQWRAKRLEMGRTCGSVGFKERFSAHTGAAGRAKQGRHSSIEVGKALALAVESVPTDERFCTMAALS